LKITVFGGSSPKPGEQAYKEARLLGQLLGQSTYTVLTGGYIGTMEAISQGAKNAGAHVIGVTCTEIERWRPIKANSFVMEEWHFETLVERLNKLIEACDAAIALPGGVGTLAEISVMWNRMLIGDIPARPLIAVGQSWQQVISTFISGQDHYIPEHDRYFITFVDTVQEAVDKINNHFKSREQS
jgi:uncharacterized protein (TIGR00730 family)